MNTTTSTTGEASTADATTPPTSDNPKEMLFCHIPAALISSPPQVLAVAATRRCKRLLVVLPNKLVNNWTACMDKHTEPCVSVSDTVSDSKTLVPSQPTNSHKVAPRAPKALPNLPQTPKNRPLDRSASGPARNGPTGPRALVGLIPKYTPTVTHSSTPRPITEQHETPKIGLYVHTGNGYHGHPGAVGVKRLLSFNTNIVLTSWPSLSQEYAHCRGASATVLHKSRLFGCEWDFILLVGSESAFSDQLEAAMGLKTAAGGMRVIAVPAGVKPPMGKAKREWEAYVERAEKRKKMAEEEHRMERVKAQVDHQMRLAEEAKLKRAGAGKAGGWVEEWVGVLCAAEPKSGGDSSPSLLDGHDEEMHLEMHSVLQPSEAAEEEPEMGDLIEL